VNHVRFTSRDEDDILPVFWWVISSHVIAIATAQVSRWLFAYWGYSSQVTVEVVGGGSVSYWHMPQYEFWSMKVQMTVFLLIFGAFWLHDRFHS